jgi:uncharacterized protein involved in oxidation of intracellular sulfur
MKRIFLEISLLLSLFLIVGCCNSGQTEATAANDTENATESNANAMKLGIILETKEAEKAWNAFRFATASIKQGHEVKVFLMGEAVECQDITDEKFNVQQQMFSFLEHGGTILACGTCIKSRNMQATDVCPISTMIDCVEMVEWADKVLTF